MEAAICSEPTESGGQISRVELDGFGCRWLVAKPTMTYGLYSGGATLETKGRGVLAILLDEFVGGAVDVDVGGHCRLVYGRVFIFYVSLAEIMGEAKRRNRRKQAFLKEHPYCCFCGGATPATTVDHVPSRQMFSLKRRPKGLEVPACYTCNQATRHHEQVAAMLGRLFPDPQTKAEQDEAFRIMAAVDRHIPGFLKEMMPSVKQEQRFADALETLPAGAAGVLNCSGPLLNQSIQAFGAKLGLALYYATTNGLIVPEEGGVSVKWYSNFEAVTGAIPDKIFFQLLGPPKTLTQGNWGVGDQFSYAYAITESARMAAYYSTFRESFAVLSWVCRDASGFDGVDSGEIHRPGQV